MKISNYIPEMIVADIDRATARFQLMGFEVCHIRQDWLNETIVLRDPSGNLLALHQQADWPLSAGTMIARINVSDLDAACTEITGNGGRALTAVYENESAKGLLIDMGDGMTAHLMQHLKK